jgi:hypothetical protein
MPPTLIPKFLRRFLRLFSMSLPTPHENFPEAITSSFPLESYCSMIRAEYVLKGSARMNQVKVTRVWVLKKNTGTQHESLVIEAMDLESGEVFYLTFERGRCDEADTSTPPSPNPEGLLLSKLFLSTGLASLSATRAGNKSEGSLPLKAHLGKFFTYRKSRPSPTASAPTATNRSSASVSVHSAVPSFITSSESWLTPRSADDTVNPLVASRAGEEAIVFSLCFPTPSATPPLSSSSSSNPAPSATAPSSSSSNPATVLPLYHLEVGYPSPYSSQPAPPVFRELFFFVGCILKLLMADYAYEQSDDTIPGHTFKWRDKKKGNWGPFPIFEGDKYNPHCSGRSSLGRRTILKARYVHCFCHWWGD